MLHSPTSTSSPLHTFLRIYLAHSSKFWPVDWFLTTLNSNSRSHLLSTYGVSYTTLISPRACCFISVFLFVLPSRLSLGSVSCSQMASSPFPLDGGRGWRKKSLVHPYQTTPKVCSFPPKVRDWGHCAWQGVCSTRCTAGPPLLSYLSRVEFLHSTPFTNWQLPPPSLTECSLLMCCFCGWDNWGRDEHFGQGHMATNWRAPI